MKQLFTFLLFIALISCKNNNTTPSPVTDELTGTTWASFGFKSPVNNKDVYYYLAFSANGKAQEYTKYNKTELTDTAPVDITYTLTGSKLTLNYPSKSVVADYSNGIIKIDTPLILFSYTKQ